MDKKSQFVRFNLLEINYNGDSVGRDVRIEITIPGLAAFGFDKRMKAGEIAVINQEIGRVKTGKKALEKEISIVMTEKDLIFNDTGEISGILNVDHSKPFPQKFEYSVLVTERRKIFWKATAVFKIIIEAVLDKWESDNLIKYESYFGEDYNRYDQIILEAVRYWNEEFLGDTDPPNKPLDPNLVKAITYQESRVGNDPNNNGLVNIMQVGNPGDPSIETLRGELRESWIHNGKQIVLKYDVKVETVKDSVFWGVRWLFHKAQYIGIDGKRHWHTWRTAVHRYGPGKQAYTKCVWDIYTKGIKRESGRTIKLWELLILLALSIPVFVFSNNIKTAYVKEIVLLSYHIEKRPADDVSVRFYDYQPDLFMAVLENTKDWSEGLYVGRLKLGGVQWLDIENLPTEQSILSARFIALKGIVDPVLEVYGKTHVGNGNIYLYRVGEKKLSLLFSTKAVDSYDDNVWRPGGYPEYGGYSTCGKVFENGKLSTDYKDLNGDGTSDIVLSGKTKIICEEKIGSGESLGTREIKAADIPVHWTYFIKDING